MKRLVEPQKSGYVYGENRFLSTVIILGASLAADFNFWLLMGWIQQPRRNTPMAQDDCCMIVLLKSMRSADEFSSQW